MSRAKHVKISKETVRACLEYLGKNQSEMAIDLLIDASYLSKALTKGECSKEYRDKIADYLGVRPEIISDLPEPVKLEAAGDLKKGFPTVMLSGEGCYVFTNPGRYADLDTIIRIAYRMGYADRIQEVLIEEAAKAAKDSSSCSQE